MSLWIYLIVLGIILAIVTQKYTTRETQITTFKVFFIVAVFLIGLQIDLSLWGLFWGRASSGWNWKNITNYIWLGILAIVLIFMGKKLLETETLGYFGTLLLAFGTGSVLNTILQVI